MPVYSCLIKHICYRASFSKIRIKVDSYTTSNFISNLKTYTSYIRSKPVWISSDYIIYFIFIFIIYLYCKLIGYIVLLHKYNRITQFSFFIILGIYLLSLSNADSFYLCKALRFLLHNTKCIRTKCINYTLCHYRSNAFDCT